MRITDIETYPVRIPLKPPFRMVSALGAHEISDYVIVRVLTDADVAGVGEATVSVRWSGETVWGVQALIDRVLKPAVVGCDPRDVAAVDQRMDATAKHNWFAKSAIEMACWDIQGKVAGEPVYQLLGGPQRPLAVRCRFSLGAYEAGRARARAAELVAMGFQTMKVKVGGDPQRDMERVRAVREAIGRDAELVIDANCGWDADTAINCVNALSDCNIALVEQPTPDGDYAAMARVRREIDPEVMADDICFDLAHARELVRNRCCDVISLYPGKNGGIRKAQRIAEFASEHGVACSIGSNLEWDIGTAAMGHLVVAAENIQIERYPGDMLGPTYHELRIAKNPLDIQGPIIKMTDLPGLGVDVDWELVREHRCRD